jgi:hypothetical protein
MEEYEGNLTVHEEKNKNIRHIFLLFNDKTFKTGHFMHSYLKDKFQIRTRHPMWISKTQLYHGS